MPNFQCDICGGQIKMMAHRTGVCQNCGMEYDLDAMKSMMDGKKKTAVQFAASTTPQTNEISRKALLSYLADIRVLETILYQSNLLKNQLSEKSTIDNKLKERITESNISQPQEPHAPQKPAEPFLYESAGLLGFVCMIGFSIAFIGSLYLLFSGAEGGAIWTIFTGLIDIPLVAWYCKERLHNREVMKLYEDQMTRYREEYQRYENQMEEFKKNENRYNMDITHINSQIEDEVSVLLQDASNEIESIKLELESAYSANIIPMQFRNIEGVYYLYDYLSSSNQTLSEALMQANLEAIKLKIDQMIQVQSLMVIEQAQTNANMEKQLEISEAMLNNTAVGAQYAKIIALNSAVSVMLSKKQLAYQKAMFWLG